ncbi:MAG: helicase HerA domain-containing protein [Janthinobacterium lividum]
MTLADGYPIDLPSLLESHLLVVAQTGGGKSWALRRLLEQTAPHVQQLIIDPEGEFATLREKFDYVIAAPHDADAVASPQTAALLARRLLESGVSAILDIYDLKAHERKLFVQRFLESLVNSPRTLWHPVLVVVDEAHVYCPQTGSAASTSAVIDLATRGRKRGFGTVLATQRLSKLHKDAAAEMQNKMIGRMGLDLDVKRAADDLGLTPREAMTALRDLPNGEFFVFGRAVGTRGVEKMQIGPVATTHPKSGERLMQAPPAPSKRVLAQLAKLADLQKEAEHEARTAEELRAELADARRKLTLAEKRAQQAGVPEAEVDKRVRAAVAEALRGQVPASATDAKLAKAIEQIAKIASSALSSPTAVIAPPKVVTRATVAASPAPQSTLRSDLKPPEQRIVDAIAWWSAAGVETPSRHQVAFVAGYTVNGHFNNQCGTLRARGLIDYPGGGTLSLMEPGHAFANAPDSTPSRQQLIDRVSAVLKGEPMRRIFNILAERGTLSRDALAEAAGYTVNGHFNNIVGTLNGIGIAEYPAKGMVGLTKIFDGLRSI